MSDAELLARWDEAYRIWLDWYHDETPDKGWGVGQDAAFHMGRVAATVAERLRAAQSGDTSNVTSQGKQEAEPNREAKPEASTVSPAAPSAPTDGPLGQHELDRIAQVLLGAP